MPIHGNSNQNLKLLGAAESYSYLGWSVIPVLGDANPDTPKQPAADWKPYQTRRASLKQMQSWFVNTSYTALGIVTGSISQLAVLDFDDAKLAEAFAAQFPYLTETRTILSAGRGLPHYYFNIPPTVRTKSKKVNGADWLYEGRFVVASPSVINGQSYTIKRGGKAKTLTQADVNRITAFLQQHEAFPERATPKASPTPAISVPSEPQPLSVADLQGWYRHQAKVGNRNETLFRCACEARDSGWSRSETVAALAELHAQNALHEENPASRYREALRTINSAFSRSARQSRQYNTLDLPNTITENLLKRGMTDAVRVIVALRQQGIHPGQWFTQDEAWTLLKGHVGNCGMRSVLNRILGENLRLFEVHENYETLSPKNPKPVATAIPAIPDSISNCVEIAATNPSTNPRGRKTKRYRMPSNTELAFVLGVRLTRTADPLALQDIGSAKSTRKAVHRAYIARRPGRYPINWLKKRLGMSRVTVWRYNNEIPDLEVVPTYIETPLHWRNLNLIPSSELNKGYLLQDSSGKRYPALKDIAVRLMGQGKPVSLLRRWFNLYYITGIDPHAHFSQLALPKTPPFTCEVDRSSYQPQPLIVERQQSANLAVSGDLPAVTTQQPLISKIEPEKPETKPLHNPRRRFQDEDDEELVERLQKRINRQCKSPQQHISRRTLRYLIVTYGVQQVKEAIERIEGRDNVDNRVGFLVVMLRSDANVRNHRVS